MKKQESWYSDVEVLVFKRQLSTANGKTALEVKESDN